MSEIAIIGRGFESLLNALSVVVNAQADARPMYKQRPWQAVTNRRLKTVSLVVRALQPVSRILSPATTTQSRLRTVIRQYQAMRVALAVAVAPTSDHRPFYSRAPFR